MRKDIKIGITGTLISVLLFVLGLFMLESSKAFIYEAIGLACLGIGFLGSITFIIADIALIYIALYNKKVDKRNCELIKEIKNELPKETEFSINIANQNDLDLNKLLGAELKCTALFNGSTVYIEVSLPEKVRIETDDLLWFYENFNY